MQPYQSFRNSQRDRADAAIAALRAAGESIRVEESGKWIHIYLV